jgi:hypothetical protein
MAGRPLRKPPPTAAVRIQRLAAEGFSMKAIARTFVCVRPSHLDPPRLA